MAYMDPEYPSWRAKQIMLARCDLGEVIILGDSRAAADIIPANLPMTATNLAVGGGTAIEAYVVLSRALSCPTPPRLVLLSLDPGHFVRPDLFWERSVRFGLVDRHDIAALRAVSLRTGDLSVYRGRGMTMLPLQVRDLLEDLRFPPYYFAALARSLGILRWSRNERALAATLLSRGHYGFGADAGSDGVAMEGHLSTFRPLPVLDAYFHRLLALLDLYGIETRFLTMPVNEATWSRLDPSVMRAYKAYLAGYAARYALFRIDDNLPSHWPDRFFGDQFCHLNPEGAKLYSALLAQRLQAAPPSTQNEAQNGWLSETGRDASVKLVPISKRGS
ncbi:MAG: hypothetical protein U1E70_18130 [Acetobacteraceae bacterium]